MLLIGTCSRHIPYIRCVFPSIPYCAPLISGQSCADHYKGPDGCVGGVGRGAPGHPACMVPRREQLVCEGEGEQLVCEGEGEQLVCEGEGEQLVCEGEGEQLVCEGEGEQLVCEGEGSS